MSARIPGVSNWADTNLQPPKPCGASLPLKPRSPKKVLHDAERSVEPAGPFQDPRLAVHLKARDLGFWDYWLARLR